MKASSSKETLRKDLNRLARIEGQVRGLQRLVEEEAYCLDIITQVQAIRAALDAVGRRMMQKHLDNCVEDALRGG